MKKRWILITITLAMCLCSWWTRQAPATEKSERQKRGAKIAPSNQSRRTVSRPSNSNVYRRSAKTVNLSALTFHTPFSEAIEILRNSTDPPLNIVVLWRDLSENASVERDTPIYMKGISGIPLRKALELLLRAVSSRPNELGYVVDGGVIIIATRASLPIKRVTRVYNITDLVAPPANYRFGMPVGPFGFGGVGFGGGLMGQGPMGAFGGAWGNYGRATGGYAGRSTMQYGSGWPNTRANAVNGLIRGTIQPGRWR